MQKLIYTLLIFLLLCTGVYAEIPSEVPIKSYVNDYGGILSPQDTSDIEAVLYDLDQQGVAQISVVTVHNLNGQDIEGFSYTLANGVLGAKDNNNGLLLLVSIDDRKYRFEVGRGLEATLNDAKMGRIGRDYLVPAFKEQDYGTGILAAVYTIRADLLNDTESSFYQQQTIPSSMPNISTIVLIISLFLIVGIPLLIIMINIFIRITGKKNINTNKEAYFTSALALADLFNKGKGGLGGFGGSFGGSSGGFSSGGGSFGGGGASGGW